MSTMRYEPWSLMSQLQGDLNKLFERRLQSNDDNSTVETSQWIPLVDIVEAAQCFILYADVPGINPEAIEISVENDVLTIKGERQTEVKYDRPGIRSLRNERATGSFYRRFSLPDTADLEHITARGQNGVLAINIPKREKAKARKITVSNSDK